jgi:hypothetical protein
MIKRGRERERSRKIYRDILRKKKTERKAEVERNRETLK